jgi:hypothetical protein
MGPEFVFSMVRIDEVHFSCSGRLESRVNFPAGMIDSQIYAQQFIADFGFRNADGHAHLGFSRFRL